VFFTKATILSTVVVKIDYNSKFTVKCFPQLVWFFPKALSTKVPTGSLPDIVKSAVLATAPSRISTIPTGGGGGLDSHCIIVAKFPKPAEHSAGLFVLRPLRRREMDLGIKPKLEGVDSRSHSGSTGQA